jgi:hypothetical protein
VPRREVPLRDATCLAVKSEINSLFLRLRHLNLVALVAQAWLSAFRCQLSATRSRIFPTANVRTSCIIGLFGKRLTMGDCNARPASILPRQRSLVKGANGRRASFGNLNFFMRWTHCCFQFSFAPPNP